MNAQLIEAYRFHKYWSGYIVGECAKSAIQLARAEIAAERLGIEFEWDEDPCHDNGPEDWGWPEHDVKRFWRTSHEVTQCIATLHGEDVASLGGIWDASPEYRRTVEAELALEAIPANDFGLALIARGKQAA